MADSVGNINYLWVIYNVNQCYVKNKSFFYSSEVLPFDLSFTPIKSTQLCNDIPNTFTNENPTVELNNNHVFWGISFIRRLSLWTWDIFTFIKYFLLVTMFQISNCNSNYCTVNIYHACEHSGLKDFWNTLINGRHWRYERI